MPTTYGQIEPPNPKVAGEYELTRRDADATAGYELGLPDRRVTYRWNGAGSWVTGHYDGRQGPTVALSVLHGNNGWRIVGPVTVDPRDPDPSRAGFFRYHNCWKCRDGMEPHRCPTPKTPGNCGFPHARND